MNKRKIALVFLLLGFFAFLSFDAGAEDMPVSSHPPTDVYDGWRLGVQGWTFRLFTFYEAIDKTASLGLNWIEAYGGQSLSREKPDVLFGPDMPIELRSEVKEKLKSAGIKLVNYGVVGLPNDEDQCRKVFDFAKDMGIETIVSEPPEDAFDLIERLCGEYEINVAIHNHPKPSHYWNPDTVLGVCKGRSKRIGACADTGHWARSGINPLDALKKLQGRIISLHFKDLNKLNDPHEAHDVPWGTGKCDVEAICEELHRQNFKGVFSIEYEYNWENSVPEIRQSVEYFNKIAGQLGQRSWDDLFEKDLSNAIYKAGGWTMEQGVLARLGGGDIWTKQRYQDFVLDLGFKLAEGSNSGVFIRTDDIQDCVQTGIEVQVYDTYNKKEVTKHDCGAIYDCLAPTRNTVKRAGEWNRCTIICKAKKIYVFLNGEQIIDMDLNLWTEPHKNPDGTPNKFNTAYKDMSRTGYVGFQDHGDQVWYRNIRIKKL